MHNKLNDRLNGEVHKIIARVAFPVCQVKPKDCYSQSVYCDFEQGNCHYLAPFSCVTVS